MKRKRTVKTMDLNKVRESVMDQIVRANNLVVKSGESSGNPWLKSKHIQLHLALTNAYDALDKMPKIAEGPLVFEKASK